MATIDNVIKILFEGEDRASSTMDSVSNSLNKIDQKIQDVAAPISALGDKVIALEAAFTALAVGGLTYAFIKATEFESAVVNLDKVLGKEESQQLPALVERMKGFADAYGFTASQAVDSAAEFRKASFELEASAHLAELSAKLVVGAGEKMFQQGAATSSLISILKGFKVAQEDVIPTSTHLGDVLNKLADEYATSVSELANGLTILSPIAGSLGFSMDEMSGFLIPVIEVFRSGSESATGLKTSLLSLSDPTKEVQKEMARLGVDLKDNSGKMKSVKQILEDLIPVYSKLSKEQQLQTASMIAGKDQAAKFTALLNGMETAAKATAIAMSEGKDGIGSLNKEVERGLGTTAVQIQRMIAAFENLSVAIGTKYKDSWKGAIEGTTDIELALKKLVESGAFDEIFSAINDFGNEAGRIFKEIAANLPEALASVDFSGLIGSLKDLISDILSLFGGISSSFNTLDFSKPEELAKIIQFVVNALESMTLTLRGMIDTWKPFVEGIVEAIKNVDRFGDGGAYQLGRIIGAFQALVDLGTTTGLVLLNVTQAGYSLSEAFKIVYNSIDLAVQSIQIISDRLNIFLFGVLEPFVKTALIAADALTGFGIIPGLEGVHESIQNLKKGFDEIAEGAKYSLQQNMEEAADAASRVIDGISGKTDELSSKISSIPNLKVAVKFGEEESLVKQFENIEKKIRVLEEDKIDLTLRLRSGDGEDPEKIKDELEKVYKEISDLTGQEVKIRATIEKYGLDELKGAIDAIELETITLNFELASPAQELKNIDETMDKLAAKQVELKLDLKAADGKKAEAIKAEIDTLQKTLEDLDTRRFNVVLNAKLEGDTAFLEQIERYEKEKIELELEIKPTDEEIFQKMSKKFDEELGTKELKIQIDELSTREGIGQINTDLSTLDMYLTELEAKKYDIQLEIEYNSSDGKNNTPNDVIEDLQWLEAEIEKATKERDSITITLDQKSAETEITGLTEKLVDLEKQRQIELKPYLSEAEFKRTFDFIDAQVGGVHYIEYFGAVNKDSVEKTKEELAKELPLEKQLELKVKMDLEQLKLNTEIIKTEAQELTKRFDIKAKLDLAEIEAESKRITASLDAMTKQFESTGDVVKSLFSEWTNETDFLKIWEIKRQLEAENEMRREAFELTKQQIEAQLELARLKIERERQFDVTKPIMEVKIDDSFNNAFEELLRLLVQKTRIWGTEYELSQLLDVPV